MDWFSWLSKTGLETILVYDYSLSFAQNELDEGDISYFNHEFLQSMGISIAKHRLEILKLARKEKGAYPQPPFSRILIAIKRTKRCFSKYLRPPWPRVREDSLALALVTRRSYSPRWKSSTLLRSNKRITMPSRSRAFAGKAPLLLTNGSPVFFQSSRIDSFSSPLVHGHPVEADGDDRKEEGEDYDKYWSSVVEGDTMFHNLNPT